MLRVTVYEWVEISLDYRGTSPQGWSGTSDAGLSPKVEVGGRWGWGDQVAVTLRRSLAVMSDDLGTSTFCCPAHQSLDIWLSGKTSRGTTTLQRYEKGSVLRFPEITFHPCESQLLSGIPVRVCVYLRNDALLIPALGLVIRGCYYS